MNHFDISMFSIVQNKNHATSQTPRMFLVANKVSVVGVDNAAGVTVTMVMVTPGHHHPLSSGLRTSVSVGIL